MLTFVQFYSGIKGPPKGVLMSHQNVMSSMLAYTNVAEIFETDVYMAYLPLAHVLELIGGKSLTNPFIVVAFEFLMILSV